MVCVGTISRLLCMVLLPEAFLFHRAESNDPEIGPTEMQGAGPT